MTSSAVETLPLAIAVEVTDDELRVDLADGRKISVPLAWFPKLQQSPPASRQNWIFLGEGEGIHWPDADEDLSVAGLLAGWHRSAIPESGAA